ncbi:MAG: YjbQ family protein, partial [Spirochaetes bacterium]|nr:YjbQ family protein [Spirochaetota bacterium]
MKSHKKELWFNTKNRYELVRITDDVRREVKESGVKEGLCLVNAMHISASVF